MHVPCGDVTEVGFGLGEELIAGFERAVRGLFVAKGSGFVVGPARFRSHKYVSEEEDEDGRPRLSVYSTIPQGKVRGR